MPPNTETVFWEVVHLFLTNLPAAEERVRADPSLLELRDGIGETILHYLVVEDDSDAVESLLKLGAPVDSTNIFGHTPLMEAAGLGHENLCHILLNYDANYRYISPQGQSPLSHAALFSQRDPFILFLCVFATGEDLRPYFDDVELDLILARNDDIARLLREHGLTKPTFGRD